VQATQNLYNDLARVTQIGLKGSPEGWQSLGIDDDYLGDDEVPALTRDTLEDFRTGAGDWAEARGFEQIPAGSFGSVLPSGVDRAGRGGLFWASVQVCKGQPRVALAVIDCGDFRMAYKF
jgi:hypothetical protein